MSLPDSTAAAAMGADVVRPVWFCYMDFVGDPLRANSSGQNITVSGSGQPDLDGTFVGIDHRFVDISPVKSSPGGSDTVTARLSGLPVLDTDDRNLLGNPANWQGRVVRMWQLIRDENDIQQGGVRHFFTGYMMSLTHVGSPDSLTIEVSIESYLAAFSEASNRTYLDQEDYDPDDFSGRAAIATANGNYRGLVTRGAGGGGYMGAPVYPIVSSVQYGSLRR